MKISFLLVLVLFTTSVQALSDPCKKTCTLNAECGTGGLCSAGTCTLQPHFCVNDRWSANERGEYQDCSAYNCNDKTGLCRTMAVDSGDCTTGYVHDGKGSCVKSIKCDTADPACQDLLSKWQTTRKNWEQLNPEPSLPVYSCQSCENHKQCNADEGSARPEKMCWNKRCVPNARYCGKLESGEAVSKSKDLVVQTCAEYSCDTVSGECRNFCLDDNQCLAGFVCSADRRCVSTLR